MSTDPKQPITLGDSYDGAVRDLRAGIGNLSGGAPHRQPDSVHLQTPGERFSAAYKSGARNMEANVAFLNAGIQSLRGNETGMERALLEGKRLQKEAAVWLEDTQSFEEFLNAPTFTGFINSAIEATGQFLPSAVASIGFALTGATVGIGATALSAGTISKMALLRSASSKGLTVLPQSIAFQAVTKKEAQKIINKKVRLESLKKQGKKTNIKMTKEEDAFINALYPYLRQKVFEKNAAMGGLAGAFTQEFRQGSGIAFGEYADHGLTDPIYAIRSGGQGTIFAGIGVLSEVAIFKAFQAATGSKARRFLVNQRAYEGRQSGASAAGDILKESAKVSALTGVSEGLAELGQEELSVQQRFAIDDSYTEAQANLDRLQALYMGFIGGVGVGAGTGTPAAVIGKARNLIEVGHERAAYQDYLKQKFKTEDGGINYTVDSKSIRARFKAMANPDAKMDMVWVDENSNAELSKVARSLGNQYPDLQRVRIPGVGTLFTNNQNKAQSFINLMSAGPLDKTRLDTWLASNYEKTRTMTGDDNIMVEVLDKRGNFVWTHPSTLEEEASISDLAKALFNTKDYTVRSRNLTEHMEDRAGRAKTVKTPTSVAYMEMDADEAMDPTEQVGKDAMTLEDEALFSDDYNIDPTPVIVEEGQGSIDTPIVPTGKDATGKKRTYWAKATEASRPKTEEAVMSLSFQLDYELVQDALGFTPDDPLLFGTLKEALDDNLLSKTFLKKYVKLYTEDRTTGVAYGINPVFEESAETGRSLVGFNILKYDMPFGARDIKRDLLKILSIAKERGRKNDSPFVLIDNEKGTESKIDMPTLASMGQGLKKQAGDRGGGVAPLGKRSAALDGLSFILGEIALIDTPEGNNRFEIRVLDKEGKQQPFTDEVLKGVELYRPPYMFTTDNRRNRYTLEDLDRARRAAAETQTMLAAEVAKIPFSELETYLQKVQDKIATLRLEMEGYQKILKPLQEDRKALVALKEKHEAVPEGKRNNAWWTTIKKINAELRTINENLAPIYTEVGRIADELYGKRMLIETPMERDARIKEKKGRDSTDKIIAEAIEGKEKEKYIQVPEDIAEAEQKGFKINKATGEIIAPRDRSSNLYIQVRIIKERMQGIAYDRADYENSLTDQIRDAYDQLNILREEEKEILKGETDFIAYPPDSVVAISAETTPSGTVNIWAGTNENAELSNLAIRPFEDTQGRQYQSVEHAYQTWKSGKFDETVYNNPRWGEGPVKIIGRKGTKTEDNWNVQLMDRLMRLSFEQNPEAQQALINTGDAVLTHTQDRGVWKTKFPEILTEIRESYKETVAPTAPSPKVVYKKGVAAVNQAEAAGEGINVLRKAGNKHYGNPFTHLKTQTRADVKVDSLQEAVDRYKSWLEGTSDTDVQQERRNWILEQIRSGALDGKNLLYYSTQTPNHAEALAEFITRERTATPSDPSPQPATPIVRIEDTAKYKRVTEQEDRLLDQIETLEFKLEEEQGRLLESVKAVEEMSAEERVQIEWDYRVFKQEAPGGTGGYLGGRASKKKVVMPKEVFTNVVEEDIGVRLLNAFRDITTKHLQLDKSFVVYSTREQINIDGDPVLTREVQRQQQILLDPNNNKNGVNIPGQNGGPDIILVNTKQGLSPKMQGYYAFVLAHEIGHTFVRNELGRSLKVRSLRTKLWNAFQEDRRTKEVKAYTDNNEGFHEWMADQVSLYLIDNTINATNESQSFFKRLADKIKAFWDGLINHPVLQRLGPTSLNFTFVDYVTELNEHIRRRADVLNYPIAIRVEEQVEKIFGKESNFYKASKRPAEKVRSMTSKIIQSGILPIGVAKIFMTAEGLVRDLGPPGKKIAQFFYSQAQSLEKTGFMTAKNSMALSKMNKVQEILGIEKSSDLTEAKMEILREAEDQTIPTYVESKKLNIKDGTLQQVPNPNLSPEAFAIREFLQDHYNELGLKDLGINFLSNFFPRIIDIHELSNSDGVKKNRLIDLLVEKNKGKTFTDEKGNDFTIDTKIATEIVESILLDPNKANVEVSQEDTNFSLGLVRHRAEAFRALDTALLREEEMIMAPEVALQRYIDDTVKRYQLEKRGGAAALDALIKEIPDKKQREYAIEAVNAMLGKVSPIDSATFRNINQVGLMFNVVTLLTFATFASFPDLAGPILRSKELGSLRRSFSVVMDIIADPKEAAQLAKDIGVIGIDAMTQTYVGAGELDYASETTKKWTNTFFRGIGLEQFTKFTRVFAAGMGKRFLDIHAKRAQEGDTTSQRYLEELDITAKEVDAAAAGNINDASNARYKLALARFVDESIVRPNAAQRPTWASDPRFALVWQLKSFFYAYGKTIVGGNLNEIRMRFREAGLVGAAVPLFMGAVTLLPLTMLGFDLRERFKVGLDWLLPFTGPDSDSGIFDSSSKNYRRSVDMDWGEYSTEIIDRSGLLGPFTLALPLFMENRRYGDPFWVGPLGPTAEKAFDFATGDLRTKDLVPLWNNL